MNVLVLGAGLAGIGAGLELEDAGIEFRTLEASDRPGGLATTDLIDGFRFDQTGHFLHFRHPQIQRYFRLFTVPLDRIERRAAVILGNQVVPYPFQYNLWAVTPDLRRAAIEDLKSMQSQVRRSPETLAEAVKWTWGETIAQVFMRPYNEKLWARNLDELPADCGGRYQCSFDLGLVVAGSNRPVDYPGYNGSFFYPGSGRIGSVSDALAASLDGRIEYKSWVTEIDLKKGVCAAAGGKEVGFKKVISTIPLPQLLSLAGLPVPSEDLFASTQVAAVRVGFRGAMRCPYHWIYVPDRELPFYRVGFPRNVNIRTCPEECASLTIEYTLPASGMRVPAAELASTALAFCESKGFIEIDEPLFSSETILSPAYVVYRSQDRQTFSEIHAELESQGIHVAGRYGKWDYFSMEEAFLSGRNTARKVMAEVR
jgi:protoporphyrinogen oxidase